MNMEQLFRGRQAWKAFTANHPRFPEFIKALRERGIGVDTLMEITVRYPDGTELRSGIKVKPSDLELLRTLESMSGGDGQTP